MLIIFSIKGINKIKIIEYGIIEYLIELLIIDIFFDGLTILADSGRK